MYTILYASDGSKPAVHAAPVVRGLLQGYENARVVGLYVTETLAVPYDVPSDVSAQRENRIAREISKKMNQDLELGGRAFSFYHSHGFAPGTIAHFAEEEDASMVVLGSHGSNSFEDVMLGHTTFQVLHRSDRPVLLVPREFASETFAVRKILLAVDGSPCTRKAIGMTRDLLTHFPDAKATLVYVLQAPHAQLDFSDKETPRQRERAWLGLFQEELLSDSFAAVRDRVRFRVDKGRPARTICKIAEDEQFDIVIMGSRGLGAFDRFVLGSVSRAVAHHIRIPLLVATDRHAVLEQVQEVQSTVHSDYETRV